MPPEAVVEIGALDGSGISLSLILPKNDMAGESAAKGGFGSSENGEGCRYRCGGRGEGMLRVRACIYECMNK